MSHDSYFCKEHFLLLLRSLRWSFRDSSCYRSAYIQAYFLLSVCGSCNSPFPSFFFAMYRRCSIILLDVLLSVGPIIFNCRARCDGHIDPCDYHHAKSSCPPKSLTTCRVKDCIIIAISYSKLLQHYIRYVANMPKNSAAQEKKVNAAVRFLQTTIYWRQGSTGHDCGWIFEKGCGKRNRAPDDTSSLSTCSVRY